MRQLSWFGLGFPADLTTEQAVGFVRSLAGRGRAGLIAPARPVVFELRASAKHTHWRIGLPSREASELAHRLEEWLPGLAVVPSPPDEPTAASVATELRLRSGRRPLRAELQPEISRGLVGACRTLRGTETIVVQWVVGGWLPRSPVRPPTRPAGPRGPLEMAEWAQPVLDSEETVQARKKRDEQLFACAGRVAVQAATRDRGRRLASRVIGAYQVLRVPGAGVSRRALPTWWVTSRAQRAVVNQLDPACVLRADELVAVLGWPVGVDAQVDLPGVERSQARWLRPDRRVVRLPASGEEARDEPRRADRVVAESAHPAVPGHLVLPPREALRHLHVLGPTGVGKSTLLAHLIGQDIRAGHGVVVVDPKGDLVDDVLVRLPASALERVVVLDPSDAAPVGINALAGGSGVAVDGLLGTLRSLWAASWGPRLSDVLHAGLLTLSLEPGHSLVELPLLLTDPTFRRPLVGRASRHDPFGLAGFWAWYDGLSAEAAAQVLGPVMNKLRAFVLRPDLRAVLGQAEPRFSAGQVFTERRCLLVRLPKGELGAEASVLLGSLVVQQLWQATLARSAVPAARRRPVFVYLDEFQDVVRLPLDLGDALAQARGLGVGLVLAHQHLGQLDSSLRSAVLANAGSRVAFRLDFDDAAVIARRSGGLLKPEDFSSLPPFHAYADLVAESAPRGYASARSIELPRPVRGLDGIWRANRERWGMPRAETEKRLRRLLGHAPDEPSGGWNDVGGFGVVPHEGGPS